MDNNNKKVDRTQTWWIIGLALTVTFCALMFVMIAGYISDLRKDLNVQDAKIEEIAEQQSILVSEIDKLRHPVAESTSSVAAPESITPLTSDAPQSSEVPKAETPQSLPQSTAPVVVIAPVIPDASSKP